MDRPSSSLEVALLLRCCFARYDCVLFPFNPPYISNATALIFDQVAKSGGHVTFSKADLVLKPEVGTGIFFSYTSAAGELDDGYTEVSGCPVREGGVSVAALHLRSGKPVLAGASTAAVGSP